MTFGIVASSHPLGGGGYTTEVLADSPYAYYRLNDASGNPADSSGNSRNATAVAGTPVYNTSGGPVTGGGYMTFDGSTEYVTLGNIDAWQNMAGGGVGSFECWFRDSDDSTAMALAATINDGATTALQFHRNRFASDGGAEPGAIGFYLRSENNRIRGVIDLDYDWGDGNWHHYVAAWDFDGSTTYEQYVDGVNILAIGERYASGTIANDPMATFDYPMTLGARNIRGVIDRLYNGDIAEAAFYQTYLTSTRVAAHYNAA